MNKSMSRRQKDIKSKLMAAICMLLVASIMMVSSTYAWFTLSTAPEVTGIQTAVGAHGNLEMALLPTNGQTSSITSAVGDSAKTIVEKNVTWGNLVDLSDNATYGLDQIVLFPSELNIIDDTLQVALLKTPEYGADGRIKDLKPNTVTGIYSGSSFTPDADSNNPTYGVRAVGTASGMTDRQLDYRNAQSAASTARSQAASAAASALNDNGSALANIAISYGMNQGEARFKIADIDALIALVNALQGTESTDGVLDLIETAYMQYILAYAASATTGTEDKVWEDVKALVSANNATLTSVTDGLAGAGVTLPTEWTTAINHYKGMVTAVSEANAVLIPLKESGRTADFTWEEIRGAMTPLVNPEKVKVNCFLASEVKENLGALVSSVTAQGGLKVIMETGAGVFADIADHTEDYNASVTIEKVEYNGIALDNMAARMETDSEKAPNDYYLLVVGNDVRDAGTPASGAQGTMPISDMYGYVIDLAFRTNAAESNLLLQQDAVDRIYSDNSNVETKGNGSSMTFKATTIDFSNDQVKELMSAIRIVFFDPGTMKVIANAKLDVGAAKSGTDGWTAKIYLYEVTEAGTTISYEAASQTEKDDQTVTLYTKGDDDAEGNPTYTEVAAENRGTLDENTTYYVQKTTTTVAGENRVDDNVIMALTQNAEHRVSVLVYLDGNVVTNGDVAATANTSMTGKMNIQFASSAKLVPMDYADLHTPGAAEETTVPSESGGTT